MNHSQLLTEPALLDEKSAACYIGISTNHLKLSRSTGQLFKGISPPPHIRCGRNIRYSRIALEQWLENLPQFQNNADARQRGYEIRCNARISGQSP